MTEHNDSLFKQALSKAISASLMFIPLAVSLFAVYEVKTADSNNIQSEIVCLDNLCAIKAQDKWFLIDQVIDMQENIPQEYQFNTTDQEQTYQESTDLEDQD